MENVKDSKMETSITEQITNSISCQNVASNSTFTKDTLFTLLSDLRAGRSPLAHEEMFSILKPIEVSRGCIVFFGGQYKDRSVNISYNDIHRALVLYFFHDKTFVGEAEVLNERLLSLVVENEHAKKNWDNFIKFVQNIFVEIVLSAIKNGKISAGEFLYNRCVDDKKWEFEPSLPLAKRIEESLKLQFMSPASSFTISMFNDIIKFFVFCTNSLTISKPIFPTQSRPFIGTIVLEGAIQQPRKIEIYHDRKTNALYLKMYQNDILIGSTIVSSEFMHWLYAPNYNLTYMFNVFLQHVISSISAEVAEAIKSGRLDKDVFFDSSSHLFNSTSDAHSTIAQMLDGVVEDAAELVYSLNENKLDVEADTKWRNIVRVVESLKGVIK